MRVKRLELQGFKSFKDKTIVHFDEGITGIVGPNGCGKSNVVDAFFWVMGEMSSKHLRGKSMSDLIFSGSEKYTGANTAEVTLVLDMETGFTPASAKRAAESENNTYSSLLKTPGEVSITRKIYKDGETEYQMNRVPCRLRDIQEFFMDTGLGPKAYSIIAQGEINRITTQKPEDRRTLIEEVAGISKYKKRRQESLRKIESTNQNLFRVTDIITELDKQLRSLERQAKKASQYKTIKTELTDKELNLTSHKVAGYLKDIHESRRELTELKTQEVELRTGLEKNEIDSENKKTELVEMAEVTERIQSDVLALKSKVSELENRIKYAEKTLEDSSRQNSIEEDQILRIESSIHDLVREKAEAEKSLEDFESNNDDPTGEIANLNETISAKSAARIELEGKTENSKEDLLTLIRQTTSLQNQLENFTENDEHLKISEKKAFDRYSTRKNETDLQIEKLEKTRERVNQLTGEKASIEESILNSEIETKTLSDILENSKSELSGLSNELTKTVTRIDNLEQFRKKHEGLTEGTKNLVQRTETDPDLTRIQGILADRIEVESGYEIAVESALGETLQCLLLENNEDVFRNIEILKTEDLGRSRFLKLKTRENQRALPPRSEQFPEGLEPLIARVSCPEEVKALVSDLFSGIFVLDTLNAALECWEKNPGFRYVSRDGGLVSETGVITAGSESSLKAGLVSMKRELEIARNLESQLREKISLKKSEIQSQSEKLDSATTELENTRNDLTEFLVRLEVSQSELAGLESTTESVEAELNQLEKDLSEIREKRLAADAECERQRQLLNEKLAAKEMLESDIKASTGQLTDLGNEIQQLSEKLTEMRIEDAGRKQRALTAQTRLNEVTRMLGLDRQRLEDLRNGVNTRQENISQLKEDLDTSSETLQSSLTELEQREAKLSEAKDSQTQVTALVNSLSEQSRSHRKTLDQNTARQSNLNLAVEKLSMEEDHTSRNILEKYRVDLRESVSPHLGIGEITPIWDVMKAEYLERQNDEISSPTEQMSFEESEDSENALPPLPKGSDISESMDADSTEETDQGIDENLQETETPAVRELPEIFLTRAESIDFDPNEEINRVFLEKRVEFLKERMRNLGDVNVSAIEEYDRLKIRFDFLEAQREDLAKSIEDLENAIDRINKASVERFKEAFDLVNEKFKKVFPVIFGGGRAELLLTDPENFLETGVDIIAQPPGKKNQNITLLSGGEKAMTAISLLFSIFLVKPSPFCLLDEVDAPLDDANIGRYNDLLREMSRKSQFIVVTHNKRTMELNDRLFGVTMEEPGISKVVNIQVQ